MRMEGAGVHAAVSAIDWGVTRMLRRAAALAALLTIGASGVSLSREAPYLGNWARADGKTRIHVAHCGGEVCARNTWVRHGVSGEKVGDRLILTSSPPALSIGRGKPSTRSATGPIRSAFASPTRT
jgi:uncharacterized protein (DUF2147 family)